MAHRHDDQTEGGTPMHTHDCGSLFGCGDEKGTGVIREDIKDSAFGKRTADRHDRIPAIWSAFRRLGRIS